MRILNPRIKRFASVPLAEFKNGFIKISGRHVTSLGERERHGEAESRGDANCGPTIAGLMSRNGRLTRDRRESSGRGIGHSAVLTGLYA